MEFYSTVMIAIGVTSLILALIIFVGSLLVIIAIVKNPLNLVHKPVEKILIVMLVLFFFAGTIFLPYFGVTEILRGSNSERTESFPSFATIFADFSIGSKLLLQLLFQIERFTAYVHPHFHRARFTKRNTTMLSLLLVAFSLFVSLLALTGINERIYNGVFIHLFASFSWLALIAVSWLTYRHLKYSTTSIVPEETRRQPQLREKMEFERARNASRARKYLIQIFVWCIPFIFLLLPWYTVRFINTICPDVCLATNAGFFWQRFWVPSAFIIDACFPLFMIFKEYSGTIKSIFCSG